MSIRIAVARAILIVLAAIGLFWPLLAGSSQTGGTAVEDPVTITEYRASFDVDDKGELTAVEDIQAVFPSGRHGIFRYWDVVDSADPGVRYIPTVKGITMDGQVVRYDLSWTTNDRFLVAQVGDPDVYLSAGTHRYRLSYTIPGAISPGSAGANARFASSAGEGTGAPGSAFLWSVVAQGWGMRIDKAVVTIGLPAPAGRVQCSVGAKAARACTIEGSGTPKVTVSGANLAPRTGMTVRATMAPAAPARATLPWSITWDPILGRSVVGVILVLVGAGIALVGGIAWGRMAREDPPGFPVQYAPPNGLGPVQVVFMHREDTGSDALAATLLYLAERGVVKLDRSPGDGDDWTITGITDGQNWEALDPVARQVATELGIRFGGTFTAERRSVGSGKVLASARHRIEPAVRDWAIDAGLVRSAPDERVGQVAFGLAAVFAILGFTGWAWPTAWGLPFAAFVIGAAGLMSTGVGRRRTTSGRLVWSRAGGFERLLSTPSAEDRFDFSARKDLFISYIPYAVAFGVADRWAQKYRTAVGEEPPVPTWYPYYFVGSSQGFYSGGGLDSFSSALSSSISAYTASQSASSGGGGGGFGGGGGGGGGSW